MCPYSDHTKVEQAQRPVMCTFKYLIFKPGDQDPRPTYLSTSQLFMVKIFKRSPILTHADPLKRGANWGPQYLNKWPGVINLPQ